MATRSRKAAEPKPTLSTRVGASSSAATPSATQPTSTAKRVATTRATRTARNPTSPTDETPLEKAPVKSKGIIRKPPVEKPVAKPKKAPASKTKGTSAEVSDENDREPIKAFLRIRPNNIANEGSSLASSQTPYLKAISDTVVQMTDPSPSRLRTLVSIPPVTTYTFSHVFQDTPQSSFFARCALPLVRHLLEGENGLLFAYGVTNSGKTYSIQGGRGKEEAGILPRTLDVVFNSIDSLQSDRPLKPKGLGGVEVMDHDEGAGVESFAEKEEKANALIDQVLGDADGPTALSEDTDPTVLPVDRNYEYAIWVSYAEVYNEKIFDLLSVNDTSSANTGGDLARSQTISGALTSFMNVAAMASNPVSSFGASTHASSGSVTLHRRALGLKSSPDGLGKYIHGLREIRVRNAQEAKAVVRMGNINRRVFGTLANAVSSRSHAIFNIKIIRIHRGATTNDPEEENIRVSRLAIVDLAGSERVRNAGTSRLGESDRLREAGSINKSLMVLGQCLEAMRANQRRMATAGALSGKDEISKNGLVEKPKLAIIPFRHSKITEIFQDFFVGEGRAVMVININPYDTGFDENAHVMRFAALAREVTTTTSGGLPASAPQRLSFLPPSNAASRAPSRLAAAKHHLQSSFRKVMLSLGANGKGGRPSIDTVVNVVEEDALMDIDEEVEEEEDQSFPLVEELFARIEELEVKLYEAEMRAAMIETETREEVAQEMEERIHIMDKMYRERLTREAEENDRKTDEKMDLLHRALKTGGTISPVKKSRAIPDPVVEEEEQHVKYGASDDDMDVLDGSPSAPYRSSQTKASKRKSTPSPSKAPKYKGAKSKRDSKAPGSPSKFAARAPSIEVSDGEGESSIDAPPNLDVNPIMDMRDEDDAVMTDERDEDEDTEDSEAEEDNRVEMSGEMSSEGEGDTIQSEEMSEDEEANSDDIAAIVNTDEEEEEEETDEEEEEDEDDEDDDPPRKYVFEPLRPPAAANTKKGATTATKSSEKAKPKRYIVSSDEDEEENESFDVDQVSLSDEEPSPPAKKSKAPTNNKPKSAGKGRGARSTMATSVDDSIDILDYIPAPTKSTRGAAAAGRGRGARTTTDSVEFLGYVQAPAKKPASKRSTAKKNVTEEDVDDLTTKIGKTTLGSAATKGKAVRKSTRSKA